MPGRIRPQAAGQPLDLTTRHGVAFFRPRTRKRKRYTMPDPSQQFHLDATIIRDPAQVDAELGRLDMSRVVVWDAVLPARDYFLSLTPNDPSYSFPRVTGIIVRELRDCLAQTFKREDLFKLAVTTHRSRDFTILVVRGTSGTGDVNGAPTNYGPRGPSTATMFHAQFQTTMPFIEACPRLKVLLFHIDKATKEVGVEISEPRALRQDEHGKYYFDGWSERILIPPLASPGTGIGSDIVWSPKVDEVGFKRRHVSE